VRRPCAGVLGLASDARDRGATVALLNPFPPARAPRPLLARPAGVRIGAPARPTSSGLPGGLPRSPTTRAPPLRPRRAAYHTDGSERRRAVSGVPAVLQSPAAARRVGRWSPLCGEEPGETAAGPGLVRLVPPGAVSYPHLRERAGLRVSHAENPCLAALSASSGHGHGRGSLHGPPCPRWVESSRGAK